MSENLAILARFYQRPTRAASDAIDKGSLAFAICMAVLVVLLWGFATPMPVSIRSLAAIFLVMLPISIVILAKWDGSGSASMTLRREFVSLLVCALFAWSAAYLPFGLVQAILVPAGLQLHPLIVAGLAHIAFLILFIA